MSDVGSFGEDSPKSDFRSGVAALVGPANAGKSTLVNSLIGKKISIVSPKQQTTRNRILGVKNLEKGQIVYLDTPGFLARRYRGEFARFLRNALSEAASEVDLSVLVLDAVAVRASFSYAERAARAVQSNELGGVAAIAVNKIDAIDGKQLLPLLDNLQKLFCLTDDSPELVPVSARSGEGVEVLEEVILRRLSPGPAYFPEEMVTDQPEEFLAAEIIREKLTQQLNKELPYSLAVSIEKWVEEDSLIRLCGMILVERESQKGIVIGKQGAKLKSVGTSARVELEKVFGKHIFLELHVRVEEQWTRSRQGLERAGYRIGNSYGS